MALYSGSRTQFPNLSEVSDDCAWRANLARLDLPICSLSIRYTLFAASNAPRLLPLASSCRGEEVVSCHHVASHTSGRITCSHGFTPGRGLLLMTEPDLEGSKRALFELL